jgi:hypothetical protein
VLENLNKLLEADELFTRGEKHLAAGRMGEALECFVKAAACCPGSSTARLAQEAIYRVFARLYPARTGGAEETEPRPAVEPKSCPVNGELPKPAAAPRKPGLPGLKRLEVPVKPLILRVEEEKSAKPKAGVEESEEPSWFLPWLEEWDKPGKSADLLRSLLEAVCVDAAPGRTGWRCQVRFQFGPATWHVSCDDHSVCLSIGLR